LIEMMELYDILNEIEKYLGIKVLITSQDWETMLKIK